MRRILAFSIFLLACGVAEAHLGDTNTAGLLAGALHPVFGLDHFLAMLSVGIVSVQIGGRSVYTVPSLFVAAMVAGGALGIYGIALPLVESGIALSVILLGCGIVVAKRNRGAPLVHALVAFFGVMHGHAHGVEMPNTASPVFYSLGFVFSTALIHVLGLLLAHVLMVRNASGRVLRHLGSAMIGIGLIILLYRG
jgi:urease accessory protein